MSEKFYTARDLLANILTDITTLKESQCQVFGGWEEIVGQELAERSHIMDIQNGKLKVAARDGASIQLLTMKKRQILYKIRAKYPGFPIDDVYIYLDKETTSLSIQNVPKKSVTQETMPVDNAVSDEEFRYMLERIRGYSKE